MDLDCKDIYYLSESVNGVGRKIELKIEGKLGKIKEDKIRS